MTSVINAKTIKFNNVAGFESTKRKLVLISDVLENVASGMYMTIMDKYFWHNPY